MMQNKTYLLRGILTEPEQLTLLRLLNAIALWAENDACSSLLLPLRTARRYRDFIFSK